MLSNLYFSDPTIWQKNDLLSFLASLLFFCHTIYNDIVANTKSSIHIIEKIGMCKLLEFKHPQLEECKKLVRCICYDIKPPSI